MAERMIAGGYPTILWARRLETLEPFCTTEAEIADSIGTLASKADHVGVCVHGEDSVRAVCASLFESMRPGSAIAIHSTTHPRTSQELAAAAADREIDLVDAPVSGGRPAAQRGKLTVMVGGARNAADKMRPIFQTFASVITHLGDVGSGQIAKLINNSVLAAKLGVAHMTVRAGRELGLDRDALTALLLASSGRSFALEAYARQSDLAAFRQRLRLFDQIEVLASVFEHENSALQTLRNSAAAFFDDPEMCSVCPLDVSPPVERWQSTQPGATSGVLL